MRQDLTSFLELICLSFNLLVRVFFLNVCLSLTRMHNLCFSFRVVQFSMINARSRCELLYSITTQKKSQAFFEIFLCFFDNCAKLI